MAETYEQSDVVRPHAELQADAWTAAFVWPLIELTRRPSPKTSCSRSVANPTTRRWPTRCTEVETPTRRDYRFFHWHLEFPEIFGDPPAPTWVPDGWPGGFSCLLGNPPWERVKLQEQEFFAARSPEIAQAPNAAARTRLIKALIETDPALHEAFLAEKRHSEGVSHILRLSGRYPLNGRGDVNTYAVFAELFRSLTAPHGRSGVIVPTGIATDATTQYFFKDLVTSDSLAALYDFENRAGIFPDVDSRMKFCLLTIAGRAEHELAASFAFFLHDPADIDTARFALTPDEITLLNPNTGTCPIFRTRRDAEITLGIYRRVPVLIDESKVAVGKPEGNPWGISFMRMFDMANDSHLFRTREQLEDDGWTLKSNVFERGNERMLPLYQGIMFGPFDHRVCDVVHSPTAQKRQNQPAYIEDVAKQDPYRVALPIYWVPEVAVQSALGDRSATWLLGIRKVTSATNERTVVAGAFPIAGLGDSASIIRTSTSAEALGAYLTSFPLDFVLRQKLGGLNLNFFYIEQLPVPPPETLEALAPWDRTKSLGVWIKSRVLELTYTAWDLAEFATELGDTDSGGRPEPPFRLGRRASILVASRTRCGLLPPTGSP